MNEQEQIKLLKLQLAESEKKRIKAEIKNSKLLNTIDAYKSEIEDIKSELEIITESLKSLNEKHRITLFLKFGSQSKKYRRTFSIPPTYIYLKNQKKI